MVTYYRGFGIIVIHVIIYSQFNGSNSEHSQDWLNT